MGWFGYRLFVFFFGFSDCPPSFGMFACNGYFVFFFGAGVCYGLLVDLRSDILYCLCNGPVPAAPCLLLLLPLHLRVPILFLLGHTAVSPHQLPHQLVAIFPSMHPLSAQPSKHQSTAATSTKAAKKIEETKNGGRIFQCQKCQKWVS